MSRSSVRSLLVICLYFRIAPQEIEESLGTIWIKLALYTDGEIEAQGVEGTEDWRE